MYAMVPTSNTSYYAMQSSFDATSKIMITIFIVAALIILAIFLMCWFQGTRLKMLELQMKLNNQRGEEAGIIDEEVRNPVPAYAKPVPHATTDEQKPTAPMSVVGALPVTNLASPAGAEAQAPSAPVDIMSYEDAIHEAFSHNDDELEWLAEQHAVETQKNS